MIKGRYVKKNDERPAIRKRPTSLPMWGTVKSVMQSRFEMAMMDNPRPRCSEVYLLYTEVTHGGIDGRVRGPQVIDDPYYRAIHCSKRKLNKVTDYLMSIPRIPRVARRASTTTGQFLYTAALEGAGIHCNRSVVRQGVAIFPQRHLFGVPIKVTASLRGKVSGKNLRIVAKRRIRKMHRINRGRSRARFEGIIIPRKGVRRK